MPDTSSITTHTPPSRLPDDFVFSQSSLQAYVDCKRRFWLTYVQRVPWPSLPASPSADFEQLLRLGATFHRMVQRAEEGVTGDDPAAVMDFPLESWLRAYHDHRPADLPDAYVIAERVLETPVETGAGVRRLMAKYDLLAADSDRTVIVDWKTGAKLTRPAILQQKMQSNVYPYVLVEAGHSLPWGPVEPQQVLMRYWFTAAPDQNISFPYDASQHASNGERIARLMREILTGLGEADFPKVADTEFARKYVCGFCTYRSLCDRGNTATDLSELEDVQYDYFEDAAALLDFGLEDVDAIAI